MVNYAVSDMLTRMRNGIRVKKTKVSVISNRTTKSIAEILKKEGFLEEIRMTGPDMKTGKSMGTGSARTTFDIYLKYKTREGQKPESVVTQVKCVSRPGVRMYANANQIPQVLNGLGIALVSTSKGVMTDKQARDLRIGGEVLCMIW